MRKDDLREESFREEKFLSEYIVLYCIVVVSRSFWRIILQQLLFLVTK
jgi:hypothetical protein